MIRKDLGYALALAAAAGSEVPMTTLADSLYSQAQKKGWGSHSQPSLYELWKQEAP